MIGCGNCCFWDKAAAADSKGSCHRFPQSIEKAGTDWCGEFVKGPNRQDVSKYMDKKPRDDR